MAWEKVITGYKIKFFKEDSTIPTDAIFLDSKVMTYFNQFATEYFRFLVPIYKKKNIKRK